VELSGIGRGGKSMQEMKLSSREISPEHPEYESLDKLIKGINIALQPGKEELLKKVMSDLAENQRAQFGGNSPEQRTKGLINKKMEVSS
jgi:hypothetical protein